MAQTKHFVRFSNAYRWLIFLSFVSLCFSLLFSRVDCDSLVAYIECVIFMILLRKINLDGILILVRTVGLRREFLWAAGTPKKLSVYSGIKRGRL